VTYIQYGKSSICFIWAGLLGAMGLAADIDTIQPFSMMARVAVH
jgi:hypothetical protein